jgi:ABC-type spermidine/putrescine transport system permease subunit I
MVVLFLNIVTPETRRPSSVLTTLSQLIRRLLSSYYKLMAWAVGLGALAIALGALLAVPLSRANLSRARTQRARTDSVTVMARTMWTSHMARRLAFMIALPLAGLAYTLVSPGVRVPSPRPSYSRARSAS